MHAWFGLVREGADRCNWWMNLNGTTLHFTLSSSSTSFFRGYFLLQNNQWMDSWQKKGAFSFDSIPFLNLSFHIRGQNRTITLTQRQVRLKHTLYIFLSFSIQFSLFIQKACFFPPQIQRGERASGQTPSLSLIEQADRQHSIA